MRYSDGIFRRCCYRDLDCSAYEVSPQVATEMLMRDRSTILVDVRTKQEYDEGHLEGAILIPEYELKKNLCLIPDRNSVIILYCQYGGRSRKAMLRLRELGYCNVYSICRRLDNWS